MSHSDVVNPTPPTTPPGSGSSGSSRNKRRAAIFAGALVLLAGAGIALAAYLSSATGEGAAESVTAVDSILDPFAYSPELYPGGSSEVVVGITNPNPYPVRVTSISAGISEEIGDCAAGSVTTASIPNPPTTVIQPGQIGQYTLTATMITNPDNACQGQTFIFPLTAQLESAA